MHGSIDRSIARSFKTGTSKTRGIKANKLANIAFKSRRLLLSEFEEPQKLFPHANKELLNDEYRGFAALEILARPDLP